MSDKQTNSEADTQTFVFPELGVSVQARTLAEAETKAKKAVKEQ